jgi:hypothetical protein
VGDHERYDAITLEFYEWTETHHRLAERLRSRFPRAPIVLVRLWSPSQIVFTKRDGSVLDLNTWRLRANLTLHSNEVGFRVLETGGPDRWSWAVPRDSDLLEKARTQLGASVYGLPGPHPADFNFPHNLNAFLQFFNMDEPDRLLTARGNSALHLGLQALLRQQMRGTRRQQQLHNLPELGSWGTGDDCHVWYSTGQYPESTTARRLDIASATDGANTDSHTATVHKHALELRQLDTLTVRNPFTGPRMLFLTYLTTCDDHDHRIYPRMRVHLDGEASVVIDPFHDDCFDDERHHRLHLTRTSPVGMIQPGDTTLQFYPLDAATASLPFRLVGASVLFETAETTVVDVSLEPEPVALPTAGTIDSSWEQMLW